MERRKFLKLASAAVAIGNLALFLDLRRRNPNDNTLQQPTPDVTPQIEISPETQKKCSKAIEDKILNRDIQQHVAITKDSTGYITASLILTHTTGELLALIASVDSKDPHSERVIASLLNQKTKEVNSIEMDTHREVKDHNGFYSATPTDPRRLDYYFSAKKATSITTNNTTDEFVHVAGLIGQSNEMILSNPEITTIDQATVNSQLTRESLEALKTQTAGLTEITNLGERQNAFALLNIFLNELPNAMVTSIP